VGESPWRPLTGLARTLLQNACENPIHTHLTGADWRRLQLGRCLEEPNLATVLLGQASESLAQEDYLQAYVAATRALEITISARLTADAKQEPKLAAVRQISLDRTSTNVQTGLILGALGVSAADMERVLGILEVRNEAVHEGHRITADEAARLRPVTKIVGHISGLDGFKSPRIPSGNRACCSCVAAAIGATVSTYLQRPN
jgi:hypothetical protein